MPRSIPISAVVGGEIANTLLSTRILIVGAGGIGCELVKNAVLTGFGDITLLDLDTIDLSNLNRQFLFRKSDVKQPKSYVAARTVASFNPACRITPIQGNIKEPQFDVTWFKTFALVLNALDNLDARRHVNRMCIAADIPLIESGTAGYLGQVQPIIKDVSECFDCVPKSAPKGFPVCTIRSTPSEPIHCIVWAKTYLFPQLFGEKDTDSSDLDQAIAQGENVNEIDSLRKEASSFRDLHESMLFKNKEEVATIVFNKVFREDIARLLSMSDMWKHRRPPIPLDRDAILDGRFTAQSTSHPVQNRSKQISKTPNTDSPGAKSGAQLKDQRTLSLRENVEIFSSSVQSLIARLACGEGTVPLTFDKDDKDALDFVTASANLRAWAYGIDTLTRWDVKEMAGNIIPAIATTNAIIAGLIILQALRVLHLRGSSIASLRKFSGSRNVFLQSGRPAVPLGAFSLSAPNPNCSVCRDTYYHVQCEPSLVTLGALLDAVTNAELMSRGKKRELVVFEGNRLLSDPGFDDNLGRTLAEIGCGTGNFLTVCDDAEEVGAISLALSPLPLNHPSEAIPFIFPSEMPYPPPLHKPPPPSPISSPVRRIFSPMMAQPKKRALSDDEIDPPVSPTPPSKRLRTADDHGDDEVVMLAAPSYTFSVSDVENLALEEDGFVIMD